MSKKGDNIPLGPTETFCQLLSLVRVRVWLPLLCWSAGGAWPAERLWGGVGTLWFLTQSLVSGWLRVLTTHGLSSPIWEMPEWLVLTFPSVICSTSSREADSCSSWRGNSPTTRQPPS